MQQGCTTMLGSARTNFIVAVASGGPARAEVDTLHTLRQTFMARR